MRAERKTRLRSVFISDVHLGSRDSRAVELLQFLASVEVDYLFLVGDIIDFWSLRKNFYWPQQHNEVVRAILGKAREGARVIYVPGNHDNDMREFCGSVFGNLEIRRKYVHSTADGRELLVMHGDEFDAAVKCSRWLARIGGGAYELAMRLNRGVNLMRRVFRHAVLVVR
ncbi:MAG TPA: UDP-2,3-diacylglucosamine diphosphatase [Steroidobacteraceae bacterium]|nr:UDP-2,3-diacylglucosamine diphosphatase [Steroidobacteraceae bacterium]